MKFPTSSTGRAGSAMRSLMGGICAAAALAFAAPVSALTVVGPGVFSGAATTVTFEDQPGSIPLPPGYGSGVGVSFSATTESEPYGDYGGTLVAAATAAGLGNIAATWGCTGTCGTGFSLASPQIRVGMYLSSNVNITVSVSAYKGAVLLGSTTLVTAPNVIGFVGLEDAGGIDRIVIGNNTDCPGCIHQLDNVKFEGLAAPGGVVAVPTLSQWSLIILAALLAWGAVVALRLRRS